MRLEIVKETRINEDDWYCFYVDGKYIKGSYTLANIESVYTLCKNDPINFMKEAKEILKSEEIIVPLRD